MTREEEKQEKAMELAKKHMPFCGLPITECIDAVLEMADWADQHPREGLWNAEKVTNFLKEPATLENSSNINIHINGATYHFVNDFIEDLRKAMED